MILRGKLAGEEEQRRDVEYVNKRKNEVLEFFKRFFWWCRVGQVMDKTNGFQLRLLKKKEREVKPIICEKVITV